MFRKFLVCLAINILFMKNISLFAAEVGDVVINEIAWMGTDADTYDEWIELYNTKVTAVDLSSWTLVAEDGSPSIGLTGSITGNGYYLLERSNDNTVSDISADLIYTGALNNAGESLQLKDNMGKIIDEVDCSSGWFAGSSDPEISMERKHPAMSGSSEGSWASNNTLTVNGSDANGDPLKGTPRAQNSVYDGSLPVVLFSFSVIRNDNCIVISWSTESEAGVAGFHIYRSVAENGAYIRINDNMVFALGNGSTGGEYSFCDYAAEAGIAYWYRLDVLNLSGEVDAYGPLAVDLKTSSVDVETQLVTNYPNPFNPGTEFRYTVPGSEPVRLTFVIYDLYGREVKILADRLHDPGTYFIYWNGKNRYGKPVSSGVYFCRLQSGNHVIEIRKIMKVK